MVLKPDLTKELAVYLSELKWVKDQFAEIQKLRDAGKVARARVLLKKVESSARYRRVQEFQEKHYRLL